MADIAIKQVSKSFGKVDAVSGIDIDIKSGELVVLLGPSGAGKSTTLRLTAGLEQPDQGSVWIDGRDVTRVPPALRNVAFVFQQYSLYPHLTVYDNLAFPLRSPLRPTSESDIRVKVTEIAKLLQMEDKLLNPATKLSGGQMQRVAIGRALVRNPSAYLMDEPLSSLDAKLRNDLRLELKRIQQDVGATMLYVTHDQVEALTLATRIGVLDQGRLVQVGTPQQVYENPNCISVASRLGSPRLNLLPRAALHQLNVPAEVVTIGIRAEHIQLVPESTVLTDPLVATVKRVEQLGDQHLLHVALKDTEHHLIVLMVPGAVSTIGSVVSLNIVESLWFDKDGQRFLPTTF
jgi:multiple sugar transport system ATP-binding protein